MEWASSTKRMTLGWALRIFSREEFHNLCSEIIKSFCDAEPSQMLYWTKPRTVALEFQYRNGWLIIDPEGVVGSDSIWLEGRWGGVPGMTGGISGVPSSQKGVFLQHV